ncbi:sigma-70 family RNA polymerase sigma factor [Rathayibacter sp. VKM Ac-2803]|uniref:RNA polymerase sigma factor n=1 Tax=Rathayibacter sp. VKM Ac-2803 TaxID=2609256 RepID=UPI001357D4A9|nr:sigma-70 family RNA polymerase sigma factor [Rathayibacter sp. VKM Ac-2803]MWV49578.1 sigma-70 family RNA polymerase sigma factor [Rathayibacter sp. VKM Ac-2803]
MTTVQETDAELVRRAAAGSELAFRSLYRAYIRPVYWLAHGVLRDAGEAEDIAQETFVIAWSKLGGLELASDSLLPWLATICRFQAANRVRSRRRDREQTVEADDDLASPHDLEQQMVTTALTEAILRETQGLGELDRAIFRLCATEGRGYDEAAATLGVSHATVRNRLSRVRRRLRLVVDDFRGAEQP